MIIAYNNGAIHVQGDHHMYMCTVQALHLQPIQLEVYWLVLITLLEDTEQFEATSDLNHRCTVH